MAGVVGKALRGFGKALGKQGDGKRITRVPIAKRLTERRKNTEDLFKIRETAGGKPSKNIGEAVKKTSRINTDYDKKVAARVKKFKSQKRKAIGAGTVAVVGVTGAHGAAKKKWPKYKEVMESDVVIKDGKLGLKPKKKK